MDSNSNQPPVPSELSETQKLEARVMAMRTSDFKWRERRHDPWNETYSLFRDQVRLNRLIQRQSVNIPLMKYVILTIMKDIDEPPLLYFNNLDNNEQKEVFYNAYWTEAAKETKLVIKDIVDKKQVLLYGRSFKKLNIKNGRFFFEIIDPQDILVDRYVDPANLDSARHLFQGGIWRSISDLESNGEYDQDVVKAIKAKKAEEQGMMQDDENFQEASDRAARMEEMGVPDVQSPVLGETYVELTEAYVYLDRKTAYKGEEAKDVTGECLWILMMCDGHILSRKELWTVLGDTSDHYWCTHLPFTSWACDPERTDFWSDGIGDVMRGPNRQLNGWWSQETENRTMKNLSMKYYDATASKEFVPQTFKPQAFGFYPVPGKPSEVIGDMPIGDLGNSLPEIQFLMQLAEKASAASSTSSGEVNQIKTTLGEVQLALANAKERTKSLAVFYNDSWEEFGRKYIKMMEGAASIGAVDKMKVVKKGRQGIKMYTRIIGPEDWLSTSGYQEEVQVIKDKTQEDIDQLQKLNYAKNLMPANKPLLDIIKKKSLQFAGLNMTETKDVLDFEKQQQSANLNAGVVNGQIVSQQNQGGAPGPTQPALPPVAIA